MNELMLRGFADELVKIAMAGGAPLFSKIALMPLPPSVMKGLSKVPTGATGPINLAQHAAANKPGLAGSAAVLKRRFSNPAARATALSMV